jgi:hypothetical protein
MNFMGTSFLGSVSWFSFSVFSELRTVPAATGMAAIGGLELSAGPHGTDVARKRYRTPARGFDQAVFAISFPRIQLQTGESGHSPQWPLL